MNAADARAALVRLWDGLEALDRRTDRRQVRGGERRVVVLVLDCELAVVDLQYCRRGGTGSASGCTPSPTR